MRGTETQEREEERGNEVEGIHVHNYTYNIVVCSKASADDNNVQ